MLLMAKERQEVEMTAQGETLEVRIQLKPVLLTTTRAAVLSS